MPLLKGQNEICNHNIWRLTVRSVMPAANQFPGKGPTDVDDTPAAAR